MLKRWSVISRIRLICRLGSGDSHGGYSGLDSWMGSLCTVGHGACLIVDIIGAAASGPVGPVLAGSIFREKVGAFVPEVRDCSLAEPRLLARVAPCRRGCTAIVTRCYYIR